MTSSNTGVKDCPCFLTNTIHCQPSNPAIGPLFKPLPAQQSKDEFASPFSFEPNILDKVGFPAEAEPPKEICGGEIFGIGNRRRTIFPKRIEHVLKNRVQAFDRQPAALMGGGQGDAKLNLLRVVRSAMDAAVADDFVGFTQNQRQLKPRARRVRRHSRLCGDELLRLFGPERLPALKSHNVGERSIFNDGRHVRRPQASQAQSCRLQFKLIVHCKLPVYQPS